VLAYKQKNIELYKTLLAEDFRFGADLLEVSQIGTDMNGDGINDDWWATTRSRIIPPNLFHNMAPATGSILLRMRSISSFLFPELNIGRSILSKGTKDWVVIPCSFTLTLTYNSLVLHSLPPALPDSISNRWRTGGILQFWRDESNL
jgi:hypothetical protein